MTEGITLFFILLIFYLVECIFWLHRNSAAFVSFTGRHWRLFLFNKYFGNDNGGLFFANPLPPLGKVYLCSLLPVSFSGTQVCSQISQTLTDNIKIEKKVKLIKYDEIKSVSTIDKDVFINEDMFIKCSTTIQTIFIRDILLKLISLNDEQRENEIKRIVQETFDVEKAREKIKTYNDKSYTLRICCNLLFVYIFLIVPVLVYFYGTITLFIVLLALMYLFSISVSIIFYFIHKIFYSAQKSERIIDMVKMIIFPPTAVRANDLLSLNLLANYHPLAVGQVLFDKFNFENIAKKTLIDLKNPIINDFENEQVDLTNKWHRSNLENIVTAFLHNNSVDIKNLLTAPSPEDVSCKAYCPRCEAQYTVQRGICSECSNISLLPFAAKKVHIKKSKRRRK